MPWLKPPSRNHQVAVVVATKPQSPSRGRSRCRGRSHQAAITKLEHHRKPVEKCQKVGIVRTGPPPKTGRKISEGKRERKLSKSIQSFREKREGRERGPLGPPRASRAWGPQSSLPSLFSLQIVLIYLGFSLFSLQRFFDQFSVGDQSLRCQLFEIFRPVFGGGPVPTVPTF